MNQSTRLTRQTFVGPWAGLPVAWTADDEFDEESYRSDVAACCQAGFPGVYTGGTTGEFYALEIDDFTRVTRATTEVCRQHDTPVMIGCTSTSTTGAVRRAEIAAECGADAIQVALPFWMELRDADIVPFLGEVADAARGMAFSLYETRRAKKCLTIEQHRALHERVPQYAMVKANEETIGDSIAGCQALSEFVNVFVGENRWAELGPHGAIGCCSSVIYWSPRTMMASWKMLREQDWPNLAVHCDKLNALFESLFRTWSDRGFTDSAIDRIGGVSNGFLRCGLRMRGPYPAPTPADVATMRRLYEECYPEMQETNEARNGRHPVNVPATE